MSRLLRHSAGSVCALLVLACAHAEPFPVRGEFDRRDWIVHVCGSELTYDVVFTSIGAFDFMELEAEIGASDPTVPVVFEFEAVPLGTKMPWKQRETVGVQGPVRLTRGTCDAPEGQPSSR